MGDGLGLFLQNGPAETGGIPLHSGVLQSDQGFVQFRIPRFLGPSLFIEGVDLMDGEAKAFQGSGGLFGLAPGIEFGFLENADGAGEMLEHLVAPVLVFGAFASQFLDGSASSFELFLGFAEFGELLLGRGELAIQFLASWSATCGRRGGGRGSGSRRCRWGSGTRDLVVAVHKIGFVECHAQSKRYGDGIVDARNRYSQGEVPGE